MESITATIMSAFSPFWVTSSSSSSFSPKPGVSHKITFLGNVSHLLRGQLTCTMVRRPIPFSFHRCSFSRPLTLLKRSLAAFSLVPSVRVSLLPFSSIILTLHSLFSVMQTLIEHMVVCMNPTGGRLSPSRAFIRDDLPLLVAPTNWMILSFEVSFSRTFFKSAVTLVRLWDDWPDSSKTLVPQLKYLVVLFQILAIFSVSPCSGFLNFFSSSVSPVNFFLVILHDWWESN